MSFPVKLPKQGISPSVFGACVWIASHKLSLQGVLTAEGTVAITRLLPCLNCRTSIGFFSRNVIDPRATSDQVVWWDSAHCFVSAKLNKVIPNKADLLVLKQKCMSSPTDEVFGMLMFFTNHFGDSLDLRTLKQDLMRSNPQVQALAATESFSELVHTFNSFDLEVCMPEHLALWLIEGARSVSR
jgi:hypothetical protein